MNDNDSKGVSYWAGFFMLIAFVIAGLMVSGVFTGWIWTAMTGKSIEAYSNPTIEDSNALKLIQAIMAITAFLIPTIITATILSRRPLKLIGFQTRGIKPIQIGQVVLIMGAALFVSGALSYIMEIIPIPADWKASFEKLEDDYTSKVAVITSLKTPGDYIIALIIMAFIPAFCEEVLFRGGFQNFMTRASKRPWLSIVIVSVLFSLAHISYYGFLSRVILGIALGAIYYYSGRIWLSILAHFLNNAFALTMVYIYTQQGKSIKDAMREETGSLWGLIALPVLILLITAFKKQSRLTNGI